MSSKLSKYVGEIAIVMQLTCAGAIVGGVYNGHAHTPDDYETQKGESAYVVNSDGQRILTHKYLDAKVSAFFQGVGIGALVAASVGTAGITYVRGKYFKK
ncbi:hypothetical protein HZC31_01180 [Candidatus Woesearchaeota archaeon]|nr:hypothetical protein [Candidatus Woesearchaeota archaeon]